MIKYLQRRYALSHKGAVDNIKGILSCALQNISFMLPVGLLYLLVGEIMNGTLTTKRIPFYVTGCIAAALLIVVCTRLEYDNTYLVTYVESGVRRVNLAEKLRKIPLSFFGKKDLADLTSSIMNDCAVLEQSQSHFVAPLYGAILSTTVIAVSLLFFNWRMALAAIWPLPVAFAIVALASGVQKRLSRKAMAPGGSCAASVREAGPGSGSDFRQSPWAPGSPPPGPYAANGYPDRSCSFLLPRGLRVRQRQPQLIPGPAEPGFHRARRHPQQRRNVRHRQVLIVIQHHRRPLVPGQGQHRVPQLRPRVLPGCRLGRQVLQIHLPAAAAVQLPGTVHADLHQPRPQGFGVPQPVQGLPGQQHRLAHGVLGVGIAGGQGPGGPVHVPAVGLHPSSKFLL